MKNIAFCIISAFILYELSGIIGSAMELKHCERVMITAGLTAMNCLCMNVNIRISVIRR